MSSPHDRLISGTAADRFELEALAVLSGPSTYPAITSLAAAVLCLTRDRAARIELAAQPEHK